MTGSTCAEVFLSCQRNNASGQIVSHICPDMRGTFKTNEYLGIFPCSRSIAATRATAIHHQMSVVVVPLWITKQCAAEDFDLFLPPPFNSRMCIQLRLEEAWAYGTGGGSSGRGSRGRETHVAETLERFGWGRGE